MKKFSVVLMLSLIFISSGCAKRLSPTNPVVSKNTAPLRDSSGNATSAAAMLVADTAYNYNHLMVNNRTSYDSQVSDRQGCQVGYFYLDAIGGVDLVASTTKYCAELGVSNCAEAQADATRIADFTKQLVQLCDTRGEGDAYISQSLLGAGYNFVRDLGRSLPEDAI